MRWRFPLLLLLAGLLGTGPVAAAPEAARPRLYYFSAANCSHCQALAPHLDALLARHPGIELVEHDIWRQPSAVQLLINLLATHGETLVGTPTILLGDRYWVGVDQFTLVEIETVIETCLRHGCADAMARLSTPATARQLPPPAAAVDDSTLTLPLIGAVDPRQASLPLVTIVLGLLDSINPCAFFVLLFLLSLMVHAHSRGRMLTVGLVFVLFSGLVYFLFMAAWLNLFLATGGIAVVTLLAGMVALLIGACNVKDYFFFHRGPSLAIPERFKPGLYQRGRNLVQAAGYPSLLGGTVLLALAANSYELLCTAGLPMVYTRILTLQDLSPWSYYGYLAGYNLVYITPLLIIVLIFAATLGSHRLSEREGRVLKLLSGVMMSVMGLVLIFFPSLLVDLAGTVGLLAMALLLTGALLVIGRCRRAGRAT
jgi:thiol-disulfide isomerase/thioredoxin